MENVCETIKTDLPDNNITKQDSSVNKEAEQVNGTVSNCSDVVKEEEEYIIPPLFLMS